MKEWFDKFTGILKGENDHSSDLIGAGKASAELAMDHYRYQHISKIKGVVEETFWRLKEVLGEDWEILWRRFWESSPSSPRSLDYYPDVFLEYYLRTETQLHLKDLAKFERLLDSYAWTHTPLIPVTIHFLTEETKVTLGEYKIENFKAPVVAIYNGIDCDISVHMSVLFWQTGTGTRFKSVAPWELDVLSHLSEGIGNALEYAPEDQAKVESFFQWLGSSNLIVEVRS